MPWVILLLGAVILGATLVQLLGPLSLSNRMMATLALAGGGGAPLVQPWGRAPPLVLHVLLHGGWLHLAMNMAALAAFGPPVALSLGRGLRGGALFLLFFCLCAAGGGLAQLAAFAVAGTFGVAIGASSALSGLLPAIGWLRGGLTGALRMSAPWVLMNLVLAVGGSAVDLPIAWAAHLGGLVAGFVLFPLVMTLGAPRRLRNPVVREADSGE